MPFVSQAERAAMHAAAAGQGRLGIPRKVAAALVAEDTGGKLPKRAKKRKHRSDHSRHRTILEDA